MEKIKKTLIENKVPLSFREFESKKVLFRLINSKREKTKSFSIYEKAKFSTTLKEAFNSDYRKVDTDYDTTKNNRFKKVNLLVDIPSYLEKSKKNLYLDLLNSNKEFTKNNKVSSEIIENIKYFENLVNNLK